MSVISICCIRVFVCTSDNHIIPKKMNQGPVSCLPVNSKMSKAKKVLDEARETQNRELDLVEKNVSSFDEMPGLCKLFFHKPKLPFWLYLDKDFVCSKNRSSQMFNTHTQHTHTHSHCLFIAKIMFSFMIFVYHMVECVSI